MTRILVITNDSLLAAAIASRLEDEISVEAIHVTHHELDLEDHQSLVMVIEDGKPESEPIFCSFYSSPFKTQ
jgi:dTDP-4-dehydrorhamnose reductase